MQTNGVGRRRKRRRKGSKTPCVHASIKKMHKKKKGMGVEGVPTESSSQFARKKIAREYGGKQMLGKFEKCWFLTYRLFSESEIAVKA